MGVTLLGRTRAVFPMEDTPERKETMNLEQITPEGLDMTARVHQPEPSDHETIARLVDSDAVTDMLAQGMQRIGTMEPMNLMYSLIVSGIRLGWYARDDAGTLEAMEQLTGVSEADILASIETA